MNVPAEVLAPTLGRYAAALRAAGPRRHALAAELALRLARNGQLELVRFTLAARPEAFEAFRSAVEALAVRTAPEAGGDPEAGNEARSASQSVRKRAAGIVGTGTDAAGDDLEAHARVCASCGASFRVNPRHARAHRFCSPACRSRHRRPIKGSDEGTDPMEDERPHERADP